MNDFIQSGDTVDCGSLLPLCGVAQLAACGRKTSRIIHSTFAFLALLATSQAAQPFGIQVVDDVTGRGVPLVELRGVSSQTWLTDSAGWVAFDEPGLFNVPVFFSLKSHGYEYPKDGFGMAGLKLTPQPGGHATVKIHRVNLAERLYRQTGQGIYRDSTLLGEKVPLADGLGAGKVAGQDSTQVAVYHGRLFWIWGDTNRMEYPLGNYRTSAAWSDLPAKGGLAPSVGVNFHYFTDKSGFCKAMVPLKGGEGVVWLDGMCVVHDDAGAEKLVARYQRRQGLGKLLEQGICVFSDENEIFESAAVLPTEDAEWRTLCGQITPGRNDGYLYAGSTALSIRVPATLKAVLDPASYEAWTCVSKDGVQHKPDGSADYTWRKDGQPLESIKEAEWVKSGKLKMEDCRMRPVDVATGEHITLHVGTVRWNEHRQKWLLIATQYFGKPSSLGEIYYSEADTPMGPWKKAIKVITHDRYTFYNPVQHPFFDDGKWIYFEGTYTKEFSGNEVATPRYDYNQMMYRLDLDEARLGKVRE